MTEVFFESGSRELHEQFVLIPGGLKLFINEEVWIKKMMEIKNNTSGILSFKKRFFGWFNMFRIVKYLNFSHTGYFDRKPVDLAASELLGARGITIDSKEPLDLLLYYRSMEKNA